MTFFVFVFRRSLQDGLIKTNIFALVIPLQKTSSRCMERRKIVTLKMWWRHLQDLSLRRLEDVLKINKYLLGNALAKISVKGHNTLWKSKQGSNLLSTSHDLGSKYAYNVFKSKNKFWFWETSWKSDTEICFCHPY